MEVKVNDSDPYKILSSLIEEYFSASDRDEVIGIVDNFFDLLITKFGNNLDYQFYFFRKVFFERSDYLEKDILFLEYYFDCDDPSEFFLERVLKEGIYHFVDIFYGEEKRLVGPYIVDIIGNNCILLLRYLYEVKNKELTDKEVKDVELEFDYSVHFDDEMEEFFKENWNNWKKGIFPGVNIKPVKKESIV